VFGAAHRRPDDIAGLPRGLHAGALELRLGRLFRDEEARRIRRQLGVTEALAEAAETA